jgi:hypothetical protein
LPACPHCGGNDFVWTNAVRAGRFGRASVLLRSGRAVPLETRICRGCGHADLFVAEPGAVAPGDLWDEKPSTEVVSAPTPKEERLAPAAPAVPEPLAPVSPLAEAAAWSEVNEPAVPEKKRVNRRRAVAKKSAGPSLIHD